MFNRAGSHPRDLAIPKKASRAVYRVDGTTKIATSYAEYWTVTYTLAAAVSASSLKYWSGIDGDAILVVRASGTCDYWGIGAVRKIGFAGVLSSIPKCNRTWF